MRTLSTTGAARPAPAKTRPVLSKILKGMATALVAATLFTIQPTTQAQASWWCWSWFCTPSATDLVNGRPKLKKQTPAVKKYLTKLVEEYRSFGASESEVKKFLDKLEIQFNKLSSSKGFFNNWLISSAHAQSPTDVSCVAPPTILTVCVPTQIVKLIALAIGALTLNEASKQLEDINNLTVEMTISTGLREAEKDIKNLADDYTELLPNAPDQQPNNCNDQQKKKMGREVHKYCDPERSCGGLDKLKPMQTKIKLTEACIRARDKVMKRCYNSGDKNHIKQILGQIRSFSNCLKFIKQLS